MFDPLNPFAHLRGPVPDYLVQLLAIEKKGELDKYVRKIQITQRDFVTLIVNVAAIGYAHQIKHHEFRPAHLEPTEEDVRGLHSQSSDGKLSGEGQKFIRKISQIFKDRRLLVAHFFYNTEKWHLFYFDQRDTHGNHWSGGSHLHFVNYLWPNYDPSNLWELFDKAEASVGGNLHIKFVPTKTRESNSRHG